MYHQRATERETADKKEKLLFISVFPLLVFEECITTKGIINSGTNIQKHNSAWIWLYVSLGFSLLFQS